MSDVSFVEYCELNTDNAHAFYEEWKFKTMYLLRKKGWAGHFSSTTAIPTETEANATNATDATKKLFTDNAEAYHLIELSCSGIPLKLVRRAAGDSRTAIRNLESKYGTDLTTTFLKFANCKLAKNDDDPDEWFIKLDWLNEKLASFNETYRKSDAERKAHMLGNLPSGYKDVISKVRGNEMSYTVAQLEEEIRNKWKQDFRDSKNSTNQHALNVETKSKGKSKFKGRCKKCGKVGHKATDCKSTKSVCYECGGDGHYARDCPKKGKDDPIHGMFAHT